jgi:D-tyrosyl-tRNA(Tyr) deacylase
MRAVLQRVNSASVTVANQLVSQINKGLMVLIGIERNDTKEDMDYIVKKIVNTRFWDDENNKPWNASVKDKNFEILLVSQFTLCHLYKGNKLDFHLAMKTEEARTFFSQIVKEVGVHHNPDLVKEGAFGEYMNVALENDGPVTIVIESKKENKSN